MGRYKTYLTILLIFSVYMMPFNAARAANLGGWSLGGGVAQGASIVYNGAKDVILNGAKKVATGTAKITPPPASVAKALAGGAGAIALDLAIKELLGGVDWILDPANNRIKYSDPRSSIPCNDNCPSASKLYYFLSGSLSSYRYASTVGACVAWIEFEKKSSGQPEQYSSSNYSSGRCYATRNGYSISSPLLDSFNNPAYDPSVEDKPKTFPLDVLASQVISNAAGGNAAAQQAIKAAADTIVAEAETDSTKARPIVNQLEASQSIPTDQTATGETVPKEETGENTGTDTKGSDISLDFPIFCNWAPTVCQAANVVIQKPAEWAENIKVAYDDAVDYFKSEPEETDNELDIDQNTESEPDSSISFSTSCPAKIPLTFQWNGGTLDFSFDFTMWCQAISTFVYPIVVALGSLHALYIVAGVRQDG